MLHFKKKKENKEFSELEYYKKTNPLKYCKHVYKKGVVFNNSNVIGSKIGNTSINFFEIFFEGEEYISDLMIEMFMDAELKRPCGKYTLWKPSNKEYAKIIK